MGKLLTAIGLMSGTSMDGIDAALLRSDGEAQLERPAVRHFERFSELQRDQLRAALDTAATEYVDAASADGRQLAARQAALRERLRPAEEMLTAQYAQAAEALLECGGIDAGSVDLVAMHGQTVLHRPAEHFTLQLGDGAGLAGRLGIPVVADFRSADIAAGGQGAPLVPIYHQALVKAAGLAVPVALVNVGGVANVTYVGEEGDPLAFDTGPGNALIDDWMAIHTGEKMDCGGACAAGGLVVERALARLLDHRYFSQEPPKSLDRNEFSLAPLEGLTTEQGAATLTAFTALAVARADFFFPMPPRQWIICGGGAHNPTLMGEFRRRLGGVVSTADELGWSADFMEAEAFAYLGVRHMRGLPLSFPSTTGVPRPMSGGRLFPPGKM